MISKIKLNDKIVSKKLTKNGIVSTMGDDYIYFRIRNIQWFGKNGIQEGEELIYENKI